MDWISLRASMPQDKDLPARTLRLSALCAVLDGKQYDHLEHPFSRETTDGDDYIPLGKRRPSARSNLCRVVVDDSVSLLFSEGHFPTILAADDKTGEALADLVKCRSMNCLMIEAATKGSVGSVAILMRVLKRKPFFFVMPTAYLTPAWAADDPERLLSVTERYKVAPADLIAQGYAIDPDAGAHWFQRQWDEDNETWFLPWPVRDEKAKPRIDRKRTVNHALGFCPVVWVKNLPGGNEMEGACTFEIAIDTVIETDYLMSQAGRGLKYGSDPTLVLKDNAAGTGAAPKRTGGAARMLEMAPESDAKLLEINGSAAQAVKEHVKALRVLALEQMHGNRTDSDRLSAASSGRAMELMNQSLVWLADRMRITYADGGFLALLRMVCRASRKIHGGLLIGCGEDDELTSYADLDPKGITLRWPAWYAPTHVDKQSVTTALAEAKAAGIMSRETAVAALAPVYDVPDVSAELALIQADETAADARAAKLAAATTITESEPT